MFLCSDIAIFSNKTCVLENCIGRIKQQEKIPDDCNKGEMLNSIEIKDETVFKHHGELMEKYWRILGRKLCQCD